MSNRGRKRKFPPGYNPQPWKSPVLDSDVEFDNLLHGNELRDNLPQEVLQDVGGLEHEERDPEVIT